MITRRGAAQVLLADYDAIADEGKAATWMHCLKVKIHADEANKKENDWPWFLRVDWDGQKEDVGRGEEGREGQEGVGFSPEPPLPRYRAI